MPYPYGIKSPPSLPSRMPHVVFVTAFLDLAEDRSKDKSAETCFHHFNSLVKTGVNIHLYLSPCYQQLYETICKSPSNVLVDYIELSQLETYREIQDLDVRLPETRTPHHDTRAFLTLMNAKVELVVRAMAIEPGFSAASKATHFAWIDFSIFHVVKQPRETSEYLAMLGKTRLREDCMLIPGCWGHPGTNGSSLFTQVNWRFCGGFFLGSVGRMLELHRLYRTHWRSIVERRGLTWEVNMLALFEQSYGWIPTWFHGDHNDSMLRLPPNEIPVVVSMTSIPSRASHCIAAIDSLLPQVDHIYLSVCTRYKRFDQAWEAPELEQEPYRSKVTVIYSEDYGPATKYLGAATAIPAGTWTLVCDDDQIYHPSLVQRMRTSVKSLAVYQNHYESIRVKTSGGLVHGYVGLLVHSSHLLGLKQFPLPEVAHFVDDQWMSIYCFTQGIPVLPTIVENYRDIFAVLDGWHERIGPDSLAGLNNRADMVRALAEYFGVTFTGALIAR
jgi:hypothetical protein